MNRVHSFPSVSILPVHGIRHASDAPWNDDQDLHGCFPCRSFHSREAAHGHDYNPVICIQYHILIACSVPCGIWCQCMYILSWCCVLNKEARKFHEICGWRFLEFSTAKSWAFALCIALTCKHLSFFILMLPALYQPPGATPAVGWRVCLYDYPKSVKVYSLKFSLK